jgi:hypothetical protein
MGRIDQGAMRCIHGKRRGRPTSIHGRGSDCQLTLCDTYRRWKEPQFHQGGVSNCGSGSQYCKANA